MDTFIAIIKDGKMEFGSEFNAKRFRIWLKKVEGKKIKITMAPNTRTKSQNALYWLYLGVIERETGNEANELHELFRRTMLRPKLITVMGKTIKIPSSTTDLKKLEFGDYMEKICAETGIPIPDVESFKDERDSAPMINNKKT